LPLPESRKAVVTNFESIEYLCGFVTALRQAKITPAYLIWIDSNTQEFMRGTDRPGQIVLFELDGMTEEISQKWGVVSHLLDKFHATYRDEPKISGDLSDEWTDMFTSSQGLIVADDLKVKPTAQWGFIDKFYSLAHSERVSAGLFGQIAEGKLNIFVHSDVPNKFDFLRKVISIVSAEGGYSSGRCNKMLGLAPIGPLVPIERGLKQLFDPYGVLKG